MPRPKGTKNKRVEIPEEYKDKKHIVLTDIDPEYILFEDGKIFSKKTGKFKIISYSHGVPIYCMRRTTYSVDFLIRKYFKSEDIIKEGGYVLIKGFDDYMINKKGQIFSLNQHMVISTFARTKTGWPIVSLMKDHKRYTLYVAKLVFNTFVGEIPAGYKLRFLNERRSDCRIENLVLKKVASYFKKQEQNNIKEK